MMPYAGEGVAEVQAFLQAFGYTTEKLAGSSNRIFRATALPPLPITPARLEDEVK